MSTHVEFGAELFEDPWSAYANLRVDGAVHRFSSGNGLTGWLVTDYALARDALILGVPNAGHGLLDGPASTATRP